MNLGKHLLKPPIHMPQFQLDTGQELQLFYNELHVNPIKSPYEYSYLP
jgi:hypothetical protein